MENPVISVISVPLNLSPDEFQPHEKLLCLFEGKLVGVVGVVPGRKC